MEGSLATFFSTAYEANEDLVRRPLSTTYNANIGTQQLFPSTVIQAEDAIILTRSSHTIHTGFQYMRDRINPFYAGNYGRTGNINFDGRWTAGPGPFSTAGAGSGSPEADFFLGLPEVVQRGVDTGTWGQRSSILESMSRTTADHEVLDPQPGAPL
jgi:hypothetical protein